MDVLTIADMHGCTALLRAAHSTVQSIETVACVESFLSFVQDDLTAQDMQALLTDTSSGYTVLQWTAQDGMQAVIHPLLRQATPGHGRHGQVPADHNTVASVLGAALRGGNVEAVVGLKKFGYLARFKHKGMPRGMITVRSSFDSQ